MLELQENRNRGIFLTLTYKEDPGLLDYGDFQRFMKRYRKAHGACRFFAVGEYGETSGRGHWHAIIFNQLARSVGSHQLDSWPSGFGFIGTVTRHSIGYVAGYTLKEEKSGRGNIVRASNRPGIGLSSIRALAREAANRLIHSSPPEGWPTSYQVGGRRYPLSDGALAAFQKEYLKKGGPPPRGIDPEEAQSAAFEYLRGDAFFEDRKRRDIWAALEQEGRDGQKARRNTSL
jgi:hypothetical protein